MKIFDTLKIFRDFCDVQRFLGFSIKMYELLGNNLPFRDITPQQQQESFHGKLTYRYISSQMFQNTKDRILHSSKNNKIKKDRTNPSEKVQLVTSLSKLERRMILA